MNGTVVQCEKSLLGGVSKLVAQFSGAVRGLSTERHTLPMQSPRKPSHAWRSELERWLRV